MMDALIHKHLDARLDIQEMASEVVDQHLIFNLDALLKNPAAELARVVQDSLLIVSGFASDAAQEGLNFAKSVKDRDKQDRPIVFSESDDPNLNKENNASPSSD